MATSPSALDRAVECITQAVDNDVQGRYTDAYKGYLMGLDYMMLALKWEKNQKSRNLIRTKISEYMNRAETIKRFLDSQPNKKSSHLPSDHNSSPSAMAMDGAEGSPIGTYTAPTSKEPSFEQMDGSEGSEPKSSKKGVETNMAHMDGRE